MQVQPTRSIPQSESGDYKTTPSGDANLFNEIMGMLQDEGQPSVEDDEILQSQMMAEHMVLLHPMPSIPVMLSIEEQQLNLEANSPLNIELTLHQQPEVEPVDLQMEPQDLARVVDKPLQEPSEVNQPNQDKVAPEQKVEMEFKKPSNLTEIEREPMGSEESFQKQVETLPEYSEERITPLENLESPRMIEMSPTISQATGEVQTENLVQETSASVDFSKWTNRSDVVSEMEHHLLLIRENETTKLNLKLYPQHLGAISVELNMKNGRVQASVWLDNVQAKPLIEQAFSDLQLDGAPFEALNVQINNQSKNQREQSEEESPYDYTDYQVETEEVTQQMVTQKTNIGLLNLKI